MNKKVYIEFGVGDVYKRIKKHALENYYTIVIGNQSTLTIYQEAYNENKFLVDKRINGDWNDEYDIPKADKWSCISCFEHIKPENIDKSLIGIIKKIKKDSLGNIHIDLSDHYPYTPYLNKIKSNEWKNIISKYFTFTYKEYPSSISFEEVSVKNDI